MNASLHHILEESVVESDFCCFVFNIENKIDHISLSINMADVAFVVNQAFRFWNLLDSHIEVIQSVLKNVLGTWIVYLLPSLFVLLVVLLKGHLQIFI